MLRCRRKRRILVVLSHQLLLPTLLSTFTIATSTTKSSTLQVDLERFDCAREMKKVACCNDMVNHNHPSMLVGWDLSVIYFHLEILPVVSYCIMSSRLEF
jgi:hypothetical protein